MEEQKLESLKQSIYRSERVGDIPVLAEEQFIGAVLTNPEIIDQVSDVDVGSILRIPALKEIWRVCQSRWSRDHPVNVTSIYQALKDNETINDWGGQRYILRCASASVSAFAFRDYLKLMIEQKRTNQLDFLAATIVDEIKNGTESTDLETKVLLELQSLPEMVEKESTISLMKAATQAIDQAHDAYHGNNTFLKTGISALDSIIKGIGPGNVCLIGGTTSMGKTSAALEIAINVAKRSTKEDPGGVAVWSLEMMADELATRLGSQASKVPYSDVRNASQLSEDDFRKWVEGTTTIANLPIQIIPDNVRDFVSGHAAIKRAAHEMGVPLKLVVVDYAQLIRAEGRTRVEQQTNVSLGLKAMAKVLGVPVIALVQLDRKIGDRENRRPYLSDIKESGQYENDADQVIFCNREEYWLEINGPKVNQHGVVTVEARADWEADKKAAKDKMELIVRKNRHGPKTIAEVGFHAPTNRFWALDNGYDQEDMGF